MGREPGRAALTEVRVRLAVLVVMIFVASVAGSAAGSSRSLQLAIFDDAQTIAHPASTLALLKKLHAQVVRITLDWRTVAPSRPASPGDPLDPAYDWRPYDKAVQTAARYGIKPLLTIWGTPAWANGGQPANHAPSSMRSLYLFAYAAASRYSGNFVRTDGRTMAPVRLWLAWSEPNNPIDLSPQYVRSGGTWTMAAAAVYAQICTAVYEAVHAAQADAKVGCGATAPRGGNTPESRASIAPIAFLRAVKAAGLRKFDAWAHDPYPVNPTDAPATRPPGWEGPVELGNIGELISELTRLYGARRVWITEYGYETNPPDRVVGVTPAVQARYLRQAYLIASANPRIDLFTWSPLRDHGEVASGLLTAAGKPKPAFDAFQRLLG
jgi:hypothetical protein